MANTNITMRIDEELKSNLQKLLSELGMDITTYFTLAAKQAVMEQGMPFTPKVKGRYNSKVYKQAIENTVYNSEGKPVIQKDDEWADESEWDNLFEQMKKERGI